MVVAPIPDDGGEGASPSPGGALARLALHSRPGHDVGGGDASPRAAPGEAFRRPLALGADVAGDDVPREAGGRDAPRNARARGPDGSGLEAGCKKNGRPPKRPPEVEGGCDARI